MKSPAVEMAAHILTSVRVASATMFVCVAGYTAVVLAFAHMVTPATASGSLVRTRDGTIVGSRLIAQGFTNSVYFWPRPSAVDYNAAGAGGSNISPTSGDLADRAKRWIAQHGASAERPLPADLAAASGGGLDPHITENAALYQSERVARARGISLARVEALVRDQAFAPAGTWTSDRLVNVLELNLSLDAHDASP